MSLEKKVIHHIRKNRLFDSEDQLLLAVSGGVDSVVMLILLHELGFHIQVAHCNFGLRGIESDKDQAFVEALCQAIDVPFHSKRFETEKEAELLGLSIQMAARELRYKWFNALCIEQHLDFICTAHHADDHAETILLNLVKGKGLAALEGIPLRNGRVVRPLLRFSKDELLAEAKRRALSWREDASNDTNDYQRNFLRHEVMPLLLSLNPSLNQSFRKLSAIASETSQLSQEYLEKLLSGCSEEDEGHYTLHTETFNNHPSLNSILHHYLHPFGIHPEMIKQIALVVREGESGKVFTGGGWQVISTSDSLLIDKVLPTRLYQAEISIQESQSEAKLDAARISIQHYKVNEVPNPIPPHHKEAWLDADLLKYPLVLRLWKAGDFFYPLGMEHRQKISDFLINNKVSLPDKSKCLVVQSGDDIIWVVGYRIDQRYRLTEKSKSALRISLQEHA